MNNISRHINSVLSSKRGIYKDYKCKEISWDDISRFGAGNGKLLSSIGSNITDTRLYAKNGKLLYTMRPENFNEKIYK